MAVMNYSSGAVIFACIQFVVFAFSLVATPTAQFQTPGHGCYTLWGYRQWCGDIPYDRKGDEAFGCKTRTSHMQAGAAFAIISTIFSAVGLVLAIIMNTRCRLPMFPSLICCIVVDVSSMIAFACVAAVYNMKMCGTTFKDAYPYTAGFALLIAAWGLSLIATVILFLFACGTEIRDEEEEEKI